MSNSLNEGIYNSIDADTLVYLVAYKYRDSDDTEGALKELDNFVRTLLDNTSTTYYAGFIGGEKCFRYDVAKTKSYKSNRPPSPDWYKKWCGPMKAFLRDEWNFQVVNGIEADDAVCIYQTWCRENNKNSIMCHGDKDLYQIEGNHYDIRKHTRTYVDKVTSLRNLYRQVLTGDASDSIVGLYGCGVKSARKVIDHCNTETEMQYNCQQAFEEKLGKFAGFNSYVEMYTLCKLLTQPTDIIVTFHKYTPKPPSEEPEIDVDAMWDAFLRG